jgi:hypothetical protein
LGRNARRRYGHDGSELAMLKNDPKSPTIDMCFRLCEATSAALSAIIEKVGKQR